MDANSLLLAIRQIEFARGYTLSLLDGLTAEDWFRRPTEADTHIAWQIGHLAMAEYGLCLFRIRGRQPEDLDLMSSKFRKQFSKGSQPDPEPANNPTPAELRSVLDRVHQQAAKELAACTEQQLAEPIDEPFAVTPTKLGALFFCSHHEMLHAGQIGLLRRLLGKSPLR
ncbi:MAG TPA: DinB family protein [Candidatus Anammoximicrobium sp.]|nr:DinB family protein [Candidatus Anammoximicrobium sp.]